MRPWSRTKSGSFGRLFLRLLPGDSFAMDTMRSPEMMAQRKDQREGEETHLDSRCVIHLLPLWRRTRQTLGIQQHRLSNPTTAATMSAPTPARPHPHTHSQQFTTLSFPPDAKNCPSPRHASPQTSAR